LHAERISCDIFMVFSILTDIFAFIKQHDLRKPEEWICILYCLGASCNVSRHSFPINNLPRRRRRRAVHLASVGFSFPQKESESEHSPFAAISFNSHKSLTKRTWLGHINLSPSWGVLDRKIDKVLPIYYIHLQKAAPRWPPDY
jgi:hypothetical protein